MKKDKARVMIIGNGIMSPGLRTALMALAAKGFEVVQAEELKRTEPPKFDSLAMNLKTTVKMPNEVKQLRREQRAREVRVRKMLPKGRDRR